MCQERRLPVDPKNHTDNTDIGQGLGLLESNDPVEVLFDLLLEKRIFTVQAAVELVDVVNLALRIRLIFAVKALIKLVHIVDQYQPSQRIHASLPPCQ